MAIQALPTVSKVMYLQDLVPELAALEGDCAQDELAYAIVRQGTEADSRVIAQMSAQRRVVWKESEVQELRDANMRDEWAMEVFRCLCEAGNIIDPLGKPIFEFEGGPMHEKHITGTFNEFLERFGLLHPLVTKALRYAVWELNPDWDLRPPPGGPGEQTNS